MTWKSLVKLIVALGVLGTAIPAQAQAWPQRTVKILVPYPPGGNTDQPWVSATALELNHSSPASVHQLRDKDV